MHIFKGYSCLHNRSIIYIYKKKKEIYECDL